MIGTPNLVENLGLSPTTAFRSISFPILLNCRISFVQMKKMWNKYGLIRLHVWIPHLNQVLPSNRKTSVLFLEKHLGSKYLLLKLSNECAHILLFNRAEVITNLSSSEITKWNLCKGNGKKKGKEKDEIEPSPFPISIAK